MTSNSPRTDNFDTLMTAWLDADARGPVPDVLLEGVLARTSHTRPLPAWRIPERWIPMQLALRFQPRLRFSPTLVVVALLIVAVVTAVILVGTQRRLPPPFGIADNGRIAFTFDGRLVTQNPDGTSSVVVLPGSIGQRAPSFSRDGTKIVYKSLLGPVETTGYGPSPHVDVIVANIDGSNPVVVSHDVVAGNPLLSPDGRWVAFSTADDHAYVVAADGSGRTTHLGTFGAGAWTPSWAPDSERLAVAGGNGTLWLVNRDGSSAHVITTTHYVEVGQRGSTADWNPAGTRLLFSAGDPEGEHGLYLISLDGSRERLVDLYAGNGVWSPDGSMFAYMRPSGTAPDGASVAIADADGRPIRTLPGSYGWFMPEWSPDQTRVAILDDQTGPNDALGPPVIVILDVLGEADPVTLAAGGGPFPDDATPDFTLTWQRLAP